MKIDIKTQEIIAKVKSNYGGYESISLANDDVGKLLVIIREMQTQNKLLGSEMADAFEEIIE